LNGIEIGVSLAEEEADEEDAQTEQVTTATTTTTTADVHRHEIRRMTSIFVPIPLPK
jgi:hypothetical protein